MKDELCHAFSTKCAIAHYVRDMHARRRRREVGGDNARKIHKLSQNCELLSERTKGTEVKWRVEALASL